MPKISVIIPVYNVERFLSRCIESVLNQTYDDFEIICVNDGSPDNSAFILENYSQKDKRIKVITQKNQGLSMARNNGFENAVGEYVYFLDSDDAIHPQCLEIAYLTAEKYEADLVNFRIRSVKLNSVFDEKLCKKKIDFNHLDIKITDKPILLGTHREKYKVDFSACCKLYRRSLLDNIRFIPKIHMEDYPHTYAVLSKYPKTVVINEELYFYTQNEDSIFHSKSTPKEIMDYHTGINYIYNTYKKAGLDKEIEVLVKDFIPNILQQQLRRCRYSDKSVRKEIYKAFAVELRDLNYKKLINWRYHRIIKSMIYLYIMKIY